MAKKRIPYNVLMDNARSVALEALLRIEKGGAYANLLVPDLLQKSSLKEADRRFVTQLVYGATRMKRACEHVVDQFLDADARSGLDDDVRAALLLGSYQILYLRTPPHAAVGETVGVVRKRVRGFVNAVLRKVSTATVSFPDLATELSYPDWIVDLFQESWGAERTQTILTSMNEAAKTSIRDDGYVQDLASQLVVESIPITAGEVLVDLCAAPGGKATGLASRGAKVIACDRNRKRSRLIVANSEKLEYSIPVVTADACDLPFRSGFADHVLVDAPCSGLGSLRRRADARWQIDAAAPARLAALQKTIVLSGSSLLKKGGLLTYSVCTLTKDEGLRVLEDVLSKDSSLEPVPLFSTDERWDRQGSLGYLWPEETDGMMLFQLRKS